MWNVTSYVNETKSGLSKHTRRVGEWMTEVMEGAKGTITKMIRYDFVIYGATGFTGQFVVDFVVRAEQEHGITWAVAGRSEDKLRAVLDRY